MLELLVPYSLACLVDILVLYGHTSRTHSQCQHYTPLNHDEEDGMSHPKLMADVYSMALHPR